ncbi:replication initiation factor domain-containing protein [Brevibacillus formosus]|uniref:replication initiation factor domain-containing protein n=1 Tax=Brevibacillus formosus TaxID=54913 RepID=UPI003F1DE10C
MSVDNSSGNNGKLDMPPSSNTGAQNTYQDGMRALVDWVQGTCHHAKNLREIIEILGLPESSFEYRNKGLNGWAESFCFGSIRLYFGGTTHTGVHIIMSGQGCREFEQHTTVGWVEALKGLLRIGTKFGRVDAAIDDFGIPPKRKRGGATVKPRFTVGTLIRKAKEGCVTSYFDDAKAIEKIKLADGETAGKSIYFGSEQSRVRMVAYEKIWERAAKGYDLEHGMEHWNRFEVRMHDERAQKFVQEFVSGRGSFGDLTAGVIRQYLNYRDRVDTESNKSRWPVSRFWKNFLGEVDKLQLSEAAPDRTLMRTDAWLRRQVEPSIAEMYVVDPQGFWDYIYRGIDRLEEENYERIVRDREKLFEHKKVQEILDLEKERAKKLNDLHKKEKLDEEGMVFSDTLSMERRMEFEEFSANYRGNNYFADLADFRKRKYLERTEIVQEWKNARSDGADTGHR